LLEHLEPDSAAGRWDVTGRGVQDAALRPAECAFLDDDVVNAVDAVDLDVPVREGSEPPAIELRAGWFPWPLSPPGAWNTTSSSSTSANPSMSWTLKASVPLSNASRVLIGMKTPLGR
jgi:hypothetical protein